MQAIKIVNTLARMLRLAGERASLFKTILPEGAVALVTAALRLAKAVKIPFRKLYGMNKLILLHASCFYSNILCHFFDFCQRHTFLPSSSFIVICLRVSIIDHNQLARKY